MKKMTLSICMPLLAVNLMRKSKIVKSVKKKQASLLLEFLS